MSWKVVALVYERQVGSVLRKSVMAYCADKASDDGRGIWASKGTIAAELEAGRSSIIRTFNELVEEGLLVPEGKRACTNGATIEYRIDLNALAALDPVDKPNTRPVPERDRSQSDTGTQVDQSQSGTSPAARNNQSRSGTQTSLEHPIEKEDAREADRFQEFWDTYPHRGGTKRKRKDAEVKWSRLRKSGIPQQEIIDGARRAHTDPEIQRGYARDPTTWMNQRGWEDEIEPKQLRAINGGRHDRTSFDAKHREYARRVGQGEIDFGPDEGDPFAGG